MCVCVRACVHLCVGPVGDGESAMAVKSLGTGHGGRTQRRRRCVHGEELGGRWRVVAAVEGRRWCREEKGRKRIEVICFVCVCFAAFGMGWEAMALSSTFEVIA